VKKVIGMLLMMILMVSMFSSSNFMHFVDAASYDSNSSIIFKKPKDEDKAEPEETPGEEIPGGEIVDKDGLPKDPSSDDSTIADSSEEDKSKTDATIAESLEEDKSKTDTTIVDSSTDTTMQSPSKDELGNILPKTATNIYSLMLLGIVIIIGGFLYLLYAKRKEKRS